MTLRNYKKAGNKTLNYKKKKLCRNKCEIYWHKAFKNRDKHFSFDKYFVYKTYKTVD